MTTTDEKEKEARAPFEKAREEARALLGAGYTIKVSSYRDILRQLGGNPAATARLLCSMADVDDGQFAVGSLYMAAAIDEMEGA